MEEIKNEIIEETQEENQEETRKQKQAEAAKQALNTFSKGAFKLSTPIRAGGKDMAELEYDFTKLTGWEYVEAMDADGGAKSVFKITQKQALCLFAAAAGKATNGVDATDIKERIGAVDAMRAVQVATVFLTASARAANQNT